MLQDGHRADDLGQTLVRGSFESEIPGSDLGDSSELKGGSDGGFAGEFGQSEDVSRVEEVFLRVDRGDEVPGGLGFEEGERGVRGGREDVVGEVEVGGLGEDRFRWGGREVEDGGSGPRGSDDSRTRWRDDKVAWEGGSDRGGGGGGGFERRSEVGIFEGGFLREGWERGGGGSNGRCGKRGSREEGS